MTDGKSVLGADDKAGIVAILETLQRVRETKADHMPLEVVFPLVKKPFRWCRSTGLFVVTCPMLLWWTVQHWRNRLSLSLFGGSVCSD